MLHEELKTGYESKTILPEQKLWRAVLQRAFEDVIYPGMERPLVVQKYKAHGWFSDGGDDFNTVCSLAGFDYSYVYDTYQRMVDNEQVYFSREQIEYINWRKEYNQKRKIRI
jgi:hypothetical protein